MPTRLAVLLQRRKSADADPFHRQASANSRAGDQEAVRRFAVWVRESESLGIIEAKLYQHIDDFAWGSSTVKRNLARVSRHWSSLKPCNRRNVCVAIWKNM